MANLVSPHGGRLLPLLVAGEERKEGLEETKIVPRVRLSLKETYDLIMLAMGAFSPLVSPT
jgi:sulfate adenylyltransferase